MCSLELTVRKISVCYLKLLQKLTPILQHFSWILLTDSEIKEKIVNFKNIFKGCCHKNEVVQNNRQGMGLLFFILQHNKEIREHETVTHTFASRIEDRTNQNNNKRTSTTLKLKRKSKNMKNITSITGCYPRNGKVGDNETALNMTC